MSCAKAAELIEMPFEIWTLVFTRKDVLGGDACRLAQSGYSTEPSICGSYAACFEITLTTCLPFLCLDLVSSVLCQEIGLEERLQNDLF